MNKNRIKAFLNILLSGTFTNINYDLKSGMEMYAWKSEQASIRFVELYRKEVIAFFYGVWIMVVYVLLSKGQVGEAMLHSSFILFIRELMKNRKNKIYDIPSEASVCPS